MDDATGSSISARRNRLDYGELSSIKARAIAFLRASSPWMRNGEYSAFSNQRTRCDRNNHILNADLKHQWRKRHVRDNCAEKRFFYADAKTGKPFRKAVVNTTWRTPRLRHRPRRRSSPGTRRRQAVDRSQWWPMSYRDVTASSTSND